MSTNLDYDNFQVPFSAIFVAKRNSGKTKTAEYIVNRLLDNKRFDRVFIFSKSCLFPNNWITFNQTTKFDNMDYDFVHKLMGFQKQLTMKNKKVDEICIIFDDMYDSSTEGKNKQHNLKSLLNDLFSTGRQLHISVMVLHQYIKDLITPIVRCNIDYLFISTNTDEILDYIKKLVIYNGKSESFIDYINNNTNDYHFMVFDNVAKNNLNRWYRIKADINYLEYNKNNKNKNNKKNNKK